MLSLYRKFAMDAASIKLPRKMHFAGCELYPNLTGRKAEMYSSSISARIIAKVIKMCCEMNKNISRPLQKII